MTDAALEARLFATAGVKPGHRGQAEPDWVEIHRQLNRKHVTLSQAVKRQHAQLPLLTSGRAIILARSSAEVSPP
jgi:hypothetical protein